VEGADAAAGQLAGAPPERPGGRQPDIVHRLRRDDVPRRAAGGPGDTSAAQAGSTRTPRSGPRVPAKGSPSPAPSLATSTRPATSSAAGSGPMLTATTRSPPPSPPPS